MLSAPSLATAEVWCEAGARAGTDPSLLQASGLDLMHSPWRQRAEGGGTAITLGARDPEDQIENPEMGKTEPGSFREDKLEGPFGEGNSLPPGGGRGHP